MATRATPRNKQTARALRRAYELMRAHFGHQHWWPGETPFEVCVGAILTQNTAWSNVERAIANLKAARVLSPERLSALREARLAEWIRPTGYFNVKARRLLLNGNYQRVPCPDGNERIDSQSRFMNLYSALQD